MLMNRTVVSLVFILVLCGASWLHAAPPPPPHYQLLLKTPPAIGITSVALSPDESLVATAGGDGGVRIYDAKTGGLLRVIDGVGDHTVVFSPDGRSLVAAGFHMDKLVALRDVTTGKLVRAFAGHTEIETYAIAVSPDGKLLATAGTDKQILVWELETGTLRHRFANQLTPVSALAFSPDSRTLASGGGDRTIRLRDAGTGLLIRSLEGHGDWISAIEFSADGQRIASASCDWGSHRGHDWPRETGRGPEKSEWRLWNAASGELLRTANIPGRLLSVAFAPDGGSLACAIDQEVRLYDLGKDASPRVVTTHDGLVTSVKFSRDGASIFSASHDHTVMRIWLSDGGEEWRLPGSWEQVSSIALSDDASLLATGSGDLRFARGLFKADSKALGPGAVRLWDARTGRLLRRLGDPGEQVLAVTLTPDGRLVASGGAKRDGSGIVHVWDSATGEALWSMNDHAGEVLAIAATSDGARLATAGAEGEVRLRDIRTGEVAMTISSHARGATSVLFSNDGSFIVTGAGDGQTRILDARTGLLVQTCKTGISLAKSPGDRLFNSIGLSRDGATLASCTASVWNVVGAPVRIWDGKTGTLLRNFTDEKIQGRPIALSPDGSILATGGKSVKLYDVKSGTLLRELYGFLKRTQCITFSADGRLLFAGGNYGTTNAWEVDTGRHLVTLFTFPDSPEDARSEDWLAATPEGYYDGSAGVDRYVSWRVDDEIRTPETLDVKLRRPDRVSSALSGTP